MRYQVLYLKEHVDGETEKIDNSLFILYDKDDGIFYYYGLRNASKCLNAIPFSGTYHYTRLNTFVDYIFYIFGGLCEVITHELHIVDIKTCEYNILNFKRIQDKIGKNTEISAYDKMFVNKRKINTIISTLITHETYVH